MSSLSEKITPLHSSLLEDEPELIDLITKYINNFPGMVNELKVAFENRNWVDFEIYLHDLKSTGGNYGFMVITETVVKIKHTWIIEITKLLFC